MYNCDEAKRKRKAKDEIENSNTKKKKQISKTNRTCHYELYYFDANNK